MARRAAAGLGQAELNVVIKDTGVDDQWDVFSDEFDETFGYILGVEVLVRFVHTRPVVVGAIGLKPM
jgi:hypothetical protein